MAADFDFSAGIQTAREHTKLNADSRFNVELETRNSQGFLGAPI